MLRKSSFYIKILIFFSAVCIVIGVLTPFVIKANLLKDTVSKNVYEENTVDIGNIGTKEDYPYTQLSDLGPIGDWLGGSSTPLFTLASFFILVAALLAQMVELRATREEFSKQNEAFEEQNILIGIQRFESTFFQMTSLHNEIISSLRITEGNEYDDSGREALERLNRIFLGTLVWKIENNFDLGSRVHPKLTNEENLIVGRDIDLLYKTFKMTYEGFYERYEHIIGHYLRNLYNILRWVHFAKSLPTHKEKMDYIRIIRAQLSSVELKLIYCNCIFPQGYKMRELGVKYDLFDNMSFSTLPKYITTLFDDIENLDQHYTKKVQDLR